MSPEQEIVNMGECDLLPSLKLFMGLRLKIVLGFAFYFVKHFMRQLVFCNLTFARVDLQFKEGFL